jgi:hypothetical protein
MGNRTGNVHSLSDESPDRRVRFRLCDDDDQEVEVTYDMDVDEFNMANNGIVNRRALENRISYPDDDDVSTTTSFSHSNMELENVGRDDYEAWYHSNNFDDYEEALLELANDAIEDDEVSNIDFEGEEEENEQNRSIWNDEDGDFSSMYLN